MHDLSDDPTFLQVIEDEGWDHTLNANKLVYKDGRWRLGKVKRDLRDEWGNRGWGGGDVFVPIEYKSEGS